MVDRKEKGFDPKEEALCHLGELLPSLFGPRAKNFISDTAKTASKVELRIGQDNVTAMIAFPENGPYEEMTVEYQRKEQWGSPPNVSVWIYSHQDSRGDPKKAPEETINFSWFRASELLYPRHQEFEIWMDSHNPSNSYTNTELMLYPKDNQYSIFIVDTAVEEYTHHKGDLDIGTGKIIRLNHDGFSGRQIDGLYFLENNVVVHAPLDPELELRTPVYRPDIYRLPLSLPELDRLPQL